MLELEKTQNSHGYDVFTIKTDDGNFQISFENNLDLYWRYCYEGSILNSSKEHTFTITKENFYIYSLFEELYDSIKEGKPFKNYEAINSEDCCFEFDNKFLFKNNIIDWHSDDFYYYDASCVMIKKEEEKYKVTFKKSKENIQQGLFLTYSVRFRNSGSRYEPFNAVFMRMYQNLCNHNFDYEQIHMEEYLYNLDKQKVLKRN